MIKRFAAIALMVFMADTALAQSETQSANSGRLIGELLKLQQRISDVESSLQAEKAKINNLSNGVKSWKPGSASSKLMFDTGMLNTELLKGLPETAANCENGAYMTGLVIETAQTRDCRGCVAAIHFTCQKIADQ